VGEGYEQLETVLQAEPQNIIAINKIGGNVTVDPLPVLDESQIGFADAIVDNDGFLRRSQLGEADATGDYRFSLTIRLVEKYLGTKVDNGLKNPEAMRFGETELPHFQPNTGGYTWTDNGGNQSLINFRAGATPFAQVSYGAVMSGEVAPELLENRALLVGYTAESVKDFVSSAAIAHDGPSLVPGITIQAHAVSQILSAVYDERPFLTALPDAVEYGLIVIAGLAGWTLAKWQQKPARHLILVIGIAGGGLLLCQLALMVSWWLPLVPLGAAFLVNAIAPYPFYQAQGQLKSQIQARQTLIDQTYSAIHNGPLQEVAIVLSNLPQANGSEPSQSLALEVTEIRTRLQTVNRELRGIRETLQAEMSVIHESATATTDEKLVLMGTRTETPHAIDLHMPLPALLYEVYQTTVARYKTFFDAVVQITAFEPMDERGLSLEEKRSLGRFLEEALTNIYKYAAGTSRIKITCQQQGDHNLIQIIDNGKGLKPSKKMSVSGYGTGGYGTQRARKLARQLGGDFTLTNETSGGVRCELCWPVRKAFS